MNQWDKGHAEGYGAGYSQALDDIRQELITLEADTASPIPLEVYKALNRLSGQAEEYKQSIIKEPNTMTPYEVTVIYKEDTTDALDHLKKTVKELGGTIGKTWDDGRKRLAYPINGHDYGYYVALEADIDKEGVERLERRLNIAEKAQRWLIVKQDAGNR